MNTRFFGQYLLERGRITSQQLAEALELQKSVHVPLGTLAIEAGVLTAEQVKMILEQQNKLNKPFGELAIALGHLTQSQVDDFAQLQTSHKILLGEVLLAKGFLSVTALERELKEYNKEDEKLSSVAAATFNKVSNKDIVKTFTDLLIMMFTQFGKQDIKLEQCEMGKDKLRLFRWVIVQKFAGSEAEFNCLLSVPPKLLLQMASTMLDDVVDSNDELALDATKEFVNIATGNACAKLSENGLNFTPQVPEVYETTTKPYLFHANDVVCVHLASPDCKLEVAFEF